MKHFSQQLLFQLRNDLPIDAVIQRGLRLPLQASDRLRFQCPLCREFNTATNQNTNLARCFSCQRNFNNIDLVMLVRNTSFADAVKRLSAFFNRSLNTKTAQHR
jgi:DNA primase